MNIKLLLCILCVVISVSGEAYSPAGNRILTEWGEKIDPENVWPEYPRPTLERSEWKNLNGLWQYAITGKDESYPLEFQGEILVPFAVESALSGVGKTVGDNQALWYRRTFTLPSSWKGQEIMLNFGAVDWEADVWVNGVKIGSHRGGYTPFGFNITPALNLKKNNEIIVRVWDPTDHGYQPCGKQKSNPEGIWYTPVTGIWQTVWLEPVSRRHIAHLRTTPDIDRNTLTIEVATSSATEDCIAEVIAKDNGKTVGCVRGLIGQPLVINMPDDVKMWSPQNPFIYDLTVTLLSDGRPIDTVKSYAAMRKFSSARDKNGIVRMTLNNDNLFQFGTLDQGWWPDGLYTAPSYSAMVYDIDKTVDWGFNMIRKHVKVEPELWYTYCDRKGIIVWQDMPNGDRGPQWVNREYYDGPDVMRSPESEACYRREWSEIIDFLGNHPCISVWIPFNESWGQFKTPEIVAWTKEMDPTRLVNPASGGNFYQCGDILDWHNYPGPEMYIYDGIRVNVLGEYGGIGMPVEGHLWSPDRNWGYIEFKTPAQVTDRYVDYASQLKDMIPLGVSAAVYTQTTDVEGEVNGLMTYDRKVIKIDEDRVTKANQSLCNTLKPTTLSNPTQ